MLEWQYSGATVAFLHGISILGRRASDRKVNNYADINIWQMLLKINKLILCFKKNKEQHLLQMQSDVLGGN